MSGKFVYFFLAICLTAVAGRILADEFYAENLGNGGNGHNYQEVLDSAILEELVESSEYVKSAGELSQMFGEDMLEITSQLTQNTNTNDPARSFVQRVCPSFCAEFYVWCKGLCSQLIDTTEASLIEVVPCLSACSLHSASCCYTAIADNFS